MRNFLIGTFTVNVQVGDLDWNESIGLDTIVDTGSTYTFIPGAVLTQLGIKPEDRRLFELAGNRTVEYSIGYARLRVDDTKRSPWLFLPKMKSAHCWEQQPWNTSVLG